ncbi:hypothetical protein [Anaerosacchariphilus polymeriproducens]|nr:hypothetical protein [Anaerosacchariphilus polymeriproducens]
MRREKRKTVVKTKGSSIEQSLIEKQLLKLEAVRIKKVFLI